MARPAVTRATRRPSTASLTILPKRFLEAIQRFIDAGYDHVYVHQVGPDQEGFFRFYETKILPRLS